MKISSCSMVFADAICLCIQLFAGVVPDLKVSFLFLKLISLFSLCFVIPSLDFSFVLNLKDIFVIIFFTSSWPKLFGLTLHFIFHVVDILFKLFTPKKARKHWWEVMPRTDWSALNVNKSILEQDSEVWCCSVGWHFKSIEKHKVWLCTYS